ncbi:MAG: beta-propeller fold lactonase family protein, partial [Chthoniobacteraceae bacterium]
LLHAAEPLPEVPGMQPDGSVLLPNQWALRPAGRQVRAGDFPVNIAMHPSGDWMAVLHAGYGPHEVAVLDGKTGLIVSRVTLDEAFYGITFADAGRRLYASGSSGEILHSFSFADGLLGERKLFALRDPKQRGIPSGIAVAADGTVYVCNLWAHTISRVRLGKGDPLIDELKLSDNAAAAAPLPPDTSTDDPSITKRDRALLDATGANDPFPYACVFDEKKGRLFVSLWNQSAVAVIDTATFAVTARWPTEEHPNEMVLTKDGRRLFVANANRNTVTALDTATGRASETLLAELQPGAPTGNTPNSVALSPDGKRLFVANANINTLAVFDVEVSGKARSLGFIPTGWYPTSVRVSPDGKRLFVANGKGGISKANRHGDHPGTVVPPVIKEYIGGLMQGTVSVLDLPIADKFDAQMAAWSSEAFACMPKVAPATREASPIPAKIGDPSPIKYVIYIVKENRTYDQVLGDIKEGNGDPSLCLFGEAITPNHHVLAREFVLLDNFYVESEVSADGHEWTMGAYATDFVEKTWPLTYGHNRRDKFPYPAEGNFALATPAGGYLWDRAKEAGVTYRSYGEWVANGRAGQPGTAKAKALIGHIDPYYRSFDMAYPDVKRAARFISELQRFEQEGEMPRLQIVRLPNDHTSGTSPGKPTPIAHVGDNDLAFGRIVEAVSKSKFWPQTAIFSVEDDAQNGPDHVDAHRTIAFVASPYARRGAKDSTLYSTSSMLRTMELILGLKPMSQFDAAAIPMFASFQNEPDLKPFIAREVTVDLEEKNAKTAWGAERSRKMNFAKEDAADDLQLNEVIWRSIRGAKSPMPPPVRAAFVFTKAEEEEDRD